MSSVHQNLVAVVIPAYKCKEHILEVIRAVPSLASIIIVVDDCCPHKTGEYVRTNCTDPRVSILQNEINLGVGGAVMNGYKEAIKKGAHILVKIDGDGQMDPCLLYQFVQPIIAKQADYTKGNRFTKIEDIRSMPRMRLIGNLGLSFLNKLSSGYWKVMDPTNGYTALHKQFALLLPFEKISKRYFFETDMLFRLGLSRAVVVDIPMTAIYGEEVSNLSIQKVIFEFAAKHLRNFNKRVIYRYFMLDFNLGSIQLLGAIMMLPFGIIYGIYHWTLAALHNSITPTGTIMISALSIILGFQLLIGWLSFDVQSEPKSITRYD